MNSRVDGNNIANELAVQGLLSQVRFSGLTPLYVPARPNDFTLLACSY